MTAKRGRHRPKPGTAPSDAAASTPQNVEHQGSGDTDSSRRRLLAGLVGYVIGGGRHRSALARLTTAAHHGRELVENGADPVTVLAALRAAGEAAGLFRRRAEDVVRVALRGAATADHRNRPQDPKNATAAKLATSHLASTAYPDNSGELPGLVQYVTSGGDRPPLARLNEAACRGRT